MRCSRSLTFLLAFAGIAVLLAVTRSRAWTQPEYAAGCWEGRASTVCSWCERDSVDVRITIHPDGSVEGTIGDATLQNGRFTRNRGWFGRFLLRMGITTATEFIVTGDLEGPVIADEEITREWVKMPLDWQEDHFKGGFGTSGTLFGGEESMVFQATRMFLRPCPFE